VAVCLRNGKPHGQSATQSWEVRARDTPRAWIRTRIAGNVIELDARGSSPARAVAAPLEKFQWRERTGNPARLALGSGPQVEFSAPSADGTYFVTLTVTDTLGRSDESTTEFRVIGSRAVEVDRRSERPRWLEDAVVYGLAPSFLPDGGFSSATARLQEIAKLGATVLWLSPVAQAPPNDFGYAVTDPFKLRSTLGTEAQFRALLSAAHAYGIRVMLDIVTNHLAQQSPYFVDAQRRGARSAYYAWFERNTAGMPVHYFDWANLENLNYDDPEVGDFTLAALMHWIHDYPIDGLRLDAVWALRERAPEVLQRITAELERVNPDTALLAEASALDSYYSTHGFDAAYDWTSQLGQWAWHDVFGRPGSTADTRRLRAALNAELGRSPGAAKVLHFLNDNDTGRRFVTRYGPQQTRIAAVLLFTLPGVPLIYAGDEVGAEFEPYRMHGPIDWTDRYGLEPLYRRLVRLRLTNPVLRDGQMTLLSTNQDNRVLAFVRSSTRPTADAADSNSRIVVINFSSAPVSVQLRAQEPLPPRPEPWSALNPLDGTRRGLRFVPRLRLDLPGYGAVILQPRGTQ